MFIGACSGVVYAARWTSLLSVTLLLCVQASVIMQRLQLKELELRARDSSFEQRKFAIRAALAK